MDGNQRQRFGVSWREGVIPMLAAVALAFGVAVAVDATDSHRDGKAKPAGQSKRKMRKAGAARSVPPFVVAVRRPGAAVVVRDVKTGADVGPAVAAPPRLRFHQVAAGGDGSFVLSAYGGGKITFHRLTLGPDGRVQDLAPFPGAAVRGVSDKRSDLAVSGDRIAYLSYGRGISQIDVLSARTGEGQRWTTRSAGRISSLSWAGDTLSFVWATKGRKPARQVRTLNTAVPAGDLRASRALLSLPAGGRAAVLSGNTILVGVVGASGLSVEEFSPATGRRTKVLWTYRVTAPEGLSRDPASGHLLALGEHGLVFADPDQGVRELRADDVADAAW